MSHRVPTLTDLISLNHEIAALVKAGVPLELGLRNLTSTTGSRLAELSDRLATRMASGWTLPDAIAEEGPVISPVYVAVMKVGLASGKLPEALESLAASGQMVEETRRRVFLASLYPVICLVLAYVLFCEFVTLIVPNILAAVESFPQSWPIELLKTLHQNRGYVTMVIPAALISFLVVTFVLRENVTRHLWQSATSFRWVIGRSLNWAQFTELLALQVEQGTPLAEAFSLAADSTNDPRWQREAHTVAEKLTGGTTLVEALRSAKSLPPVVGWMLATGEKQGTLSQTLRQLTEMYRRQALRRAAIMKVWLPVVMTIVFTGIIGLTYGLAFFIPLRAFLLGLMKE